MYTPAWAIACGCALHFRDARIPWRHTASSGVTMVESWVVNIGQRTPTSSNFLRASSPPALAVRNCVRRKPASTAPKPASARHSETGTATLLVPVISQPEQDGCIHARIVIAHAGVGDMCRVQRQHYCLLRLGEDLHAEV